MAKKKEFDSLTGKPLDPLPYKPKPIPDHLDEVDATGNVKIRFSLGDYFRFFWVYLLHDAEKKLNPKELAAGSKMMTIITTIMAIGLLAILLSYVL